MNRQIRQWAIGFLTAAALSLAMVFQSLAATARISFSDPSTQVGQEFTVTMKFTSTDGQTLGDTKVTMDYDASKLEYLGGSEQLSGGTGKLSFKGNPGGTEVAAEMRFKAIAAGSASITVSDWEGYDSNGQVLSEVKTGSSAITIQGQTTSSDDALLQSLQVSPGTLDPAFSPETENYHVLVGLETENLSVSAIPNNEHATVTLEGDKGLQEGENTVVCRVTAENGSTVKNYTIVVNKAEGGENGETVGTAEEMPEVYAEMSSSIQVKILRIPDDVTPPEGMVERTLSLGNQVEVKGWVPWENADTPPYCIFYGMDNRGEKGFFRYDLERKTLQMYFNDAGDLRKELTELTEQYNTAVKDYNQLRWIAIGVGASLSALALVLLIFLVVALRRQKRQNVSSRRNNSDRTSDMREDEENYEDEDYDSEDFEDIQEKFEENIPLEAYQPEPARDSFVGQPANEPEEDDFYPEPLDLDEEPEDFHKRETGSGQGENRPRQTAGYAGNYQRPASEQTPGKRSGQVIAMDSRRRQTSGKIQENSSPNKGKDSEDFEFFDLDE